MISVHTSPPADEPENDRRMFIPAAVDDAGLDTSPFRVYCHLARHRAGFAPTLAYIAEVCRMHPCTVREAIHCLTERAMIEIIDSPGKARQYVVTPQSAWVQPGKVVPIEPLRKKHTPTEKAKGSTPTEIPNPLVKTEGDPYGNSAGDPSSFSSPHKETQKETQSGNQSLSLSVEASESKGRQKRSVAEQPESVAIPAVLAAVAEFAPAWARFIAHRRIIKKPMTAHAAELLLADLIARPADAAAALDLSVKNGWQGCKYSWLDKDRAPEPIRPGQSAPAGRTAQKWADKWPVAPIQAAQPATPTPA